MKMQKQLVTLTILVMMLISCGDKTQTEEWYIAHPEELKQEVEKCKLKSPQEILNDRHCKVIENARNKAWREQQRNAPMPKFNFK